MNWMYTVYALSIVIPVLTILITVQKRRAQIGRTWYDSVGKKIAISNKELLCQHCNCNQFNKLEGKLNTSSAMLFRYGAWNRSAACYMCIKCGYLHWFLSPDEKIYKEVDEI